MIDAPMTDAQWRGIHSFLITCPDIRVGKGDHCHLFGEAARGMARRGTPWRQWPTEYGHSGTRSIAAGLPDRRPGV